jgi:serine/threonine protein kinase/DNA-binding Lrp family transcriptional regulator
MPVDPEFVVSALEGAPCIPGYRILGLLGKGGMGRVYLGEDEALGRRVAIKVISEQLPGDEETLVRFRREARAMAALEHENIVRVYSSGEAEGLPYLVMQLIEGETLAARIGRSGGLGLGPALRIVEQVLEALEAARGKGLVHRDLKPANILIDGNDHVHVADFGLARPVASGESTTVTRDGQIVGTPAYMAPEQARGDPVDFRADLYALGVILYEMLVGEPPFRGATPLAVVAHHLQDPLPSLRKSRPDLSPEVEHVIRWLVSKDPDDRPHSHAELRRRLTALVTRPADEDEPTLAHSVLSTTPAAGASAEPPPAAGRSTPRSGEGLERRLATLLVADIPGCRPLTEHLDPDSAATTLSDVVGMLSRVVEEYGGRLEELGHDHLVAVFGFPTALEDSPREAVNAALGIQSGLRALSRERNLPCRLLARVGITTGSVIGGRVEQAGGQHLALVGEPLHAAGTLKQAAAEGEIRVGATTRRYTCRDFEYRSAPDGAGFQLLSTHGRLHRAAVGGSGPHVVQFIGRDDEMARLEVRLLGLLDGHGSIVSVVGPAGIGKSRLIAEVRSAHARKPITFLEGRAVAIGQKLSFHPIIDILKRWTGIADRDNNAQALNKLETALARILPTTCDEVLPFIGRVVGLQMGPRHSARLDQVEGDGFKGLLVRSLRQLLIAASREQPLAFVLEDLHWADQTSLEILGPLYRLALDHRILFLNVFRPGHELTSGRIAKELREALPALYEEIQLKPLTREECELLAVRVLGAKEAPTRVKRLIADKAEGNPFFVEEVGQALMECGAVVVQRGKLAITDRLEAFIVPETIQDVLLARIDALAPDTRQLVKVAAVFGREFLCRVLADVAREVDHLGERLDELERLGLIRRQESENEPGYSFKHALTQDVVYGSIPGPQRKALHLQIASAIERLFSERLPEFYGMLAYHYTAGEDLAKAEEFLVKAGAEALHSAASSEALHFYQQALHLYTTRSRCSLDPGRVAMLERNIALALFDHGQYGEALGYFDRALRFHRIRPARGVALVTAFGVSFLGFVITIHVPWFRFRRTPSESESQGLRLYYKKLSALAHHDPVRFFLESFLLAWRLSRFDLTKVENGVGMFASSGNLLAWTGMSFYLSRRVLRLLEARIDDREARSAISYRAADVTHAFLAGEWETRPYDEELVACALDCGEVFLTSNYVIFHGRLALEQGSLKTMEALAEKLKAISEQFDHLYPRVLRAYLRSKLLVKTRRLPEAMTECLSGRRLAEEAAVDTIVFGLDALRARVHAYMGHSGDAEELLRALAEPSRQRRLPRSYRGDALLSQAQLDVLRLEASLREEGGDVRRRSAAAAGSCRRLRENSRRVASHRVEAFKLSGLRHWLVGDHRRAARDWELSLRTGEQLGARTELARAYLEVGGRLGRPESPLRRVGTLSSGECLRRARRLLEDVGLEWDEAELEDSSD